MKLQKEAGKKRYEDGYLTIFLALSITVLLSLILVLLEGFHQGLGCLPFERWDFREIVRILSSE